MPRLVAVRMSGGPAFRRRDPANLGPRRRGRAPRPDRTRRVHGQGAGRDSRPTRSSTETATSTPSTAAGPTEVGDAVVILTSGTGGDPKAAVLTHDALESSAYMTATSLGVDPAARWLACLPLHHIGGFGVVSRALVTGAELEVHPGFDADAVTDAARRGATHTSLVTTALARIDPSIFRVILLGGSAIPRTTVQHRGDLRDDRDLRRRRVRRPRAQRRGAPHREGRPDLVVGPDAAAGLPRRLGSRRTRTDGSAPATSARSTPRRVGSRCGAAPTTSS